MVTVLDTCASRSSSEAAMGPSMGPSSGGEVETQEGSEPLLPASLGFVRRCIELAMDTP